MTTVNTVQYLGTGPDDLALALEIYSGKFNEAYRNVPKLFNTSLPVIHRKTMTNMGGSYQFLQLAETPDAEEEFDPGNQAAGQNYAVNEGSVTRDKYILAHHWIPRDAMRTSHFDILSRLGRADARQVGMTGDRRLFITAALAARAAAVTKNGLSVHNGGNRVTRSGGSVSAAYPLSPIGAANFRADLRRLARNMDEDNIPEGGRYLWITPYMREVLQYDSGYHLATAANQIVGQGGSSLFSKEFNGTDGNSANLRQFRDIEGFKLVDYVNTTSNNGSMPDENITTGPAKYRADFTVGASNGTPVALALCETAEGGAPVSMGTWEAVQNVVHYDPTRMAWFVGSFVLAGIGQMDPWGAGSIEVII